MVFNNDIINIDLRHVANQVGEPGENLDNDNFISKFINSRSESSHK
jgi:hypothetical protein